MGTLSQEIGHDVVIVDFLNKILSQKESEVLFCVVTPAIGPKRDIYFRDFATKEWVSAYAVAGDDFIPEFVYRMKIEKDVFDKIDKHFSYQDQYWYKYLSGEIGKDLREYLSSVCVEIEEKLQSELPDIIGFDKKGKIRFFSEIKFEGLSQNALESVIKESKAALLYNAKYYLVIPSKPVYSRSLSDEWIKRNVSFMNIEIYKFIVDKSVITPQQDQITFEHIATTGHTVSDKEMPLVYFKDKLFLQDKVVLINGLSSDIGTAIAEVFLRNGAHIAGTYYKNKDRLDTLLSLYKERIRMFEVNFIDDDYISKIEQVVSQTIKWKEKIDVLVNVSGIWLVKPFLYETEEERKALWRVNYESCLYFCQETIKHFIGAGKGGKIINIASTSGIKGNGQQITYSASKAAVISLTKSLAEEFASRKIQVNSISPGPVDTKALDKYFDQVGKNLLIKNIPSSRLIHPRDVADMALGIVLNDYLTGENIVISGGRI